ncbi:MAG: glycerate kinase [Clostridia bacterium]|nr:glycerate kinase [Clostridia bacterium]
MKIFAAPDSFKGSITAQEFCAVVKKVCDEKNIETMLFPMADGGEGTIEAITDGLGGRYVYADVTAPLGEKILAKYGILNDGTAVMEMSQASGISYVKGRENIFRASTIGTGQMLYSALESGVKKIIIGIGGSGTNDGGAGALYALGVKFLDGENNQLFPCPEELKKLKSVDLSCLDKRLENIEIIVASDVKNPLCGANGASYVFGKQKGATEEDKPLLDDILKNMAEIFTQTTGVDHSKDEGAGAAGGLGFALMQLPNVTFRPGFEVIAEILDIENKMRDFAPDLVITGEGQLNFQSEMGKLPVEIAKMARRNGFKCVAIAGAFGEGWENCEKYFDGIYQLMNENITAEYSINHAAELLEHKLNTL